MAVQVTTCRGWGHIVVAALQATQLVYILFMVTRCGSLY